MLVARREREALAQVLERLVGSEAGADGGDLEEDAAGLAEVDRLEVEAVDDRGRMRACLGDPFAPRLVILRLRGPGDVVDGACAGDSALGGRLVEVVRRAASVAADLPGRVVAWLEAERVLEEAPALARGCRRTRARSRSPGAPAPSGSPDGRRSAARRSVSATASSRPSPSGSSNFRLPGVRSVGMPASDSLFSQKSSASSEATRQVTWWIIPAPALPRRAFGYSKKVMSLPA